MYQLPSNIILIEIIIFLFSFVELILPIESQIFLRNLTGNTNRGKLIRVRKPEEANGVEFFVLDFLGKTGESSPRVKLPSNLNTWGRLICFTVRGENNIFYDSPTHQQDIFLCIGLVERYGYPAEEHYVTTEDGYNLRIHRIPSSPHYNGSMFNKPIVFLQHGILMSSDCWVLMGPKKDMAFLLADAGYDVWIGNVRGNTYSRSHQTLSPEEPEFWDYSWHEIGIKDLPAMIDYILSIRKVGCLTYVGHSMGTTVSYVLLSEKPEYNKKIKVVISLAPVAYWTHRNALNMYANIIPVFQRLFDPQRKYEVFPQSPMMPAFAKRWCVNWSLQLCTRPITALTGTDPDEFNSRLIVYIASYFPAGISTKTFYHYHQNLYTGSFRKYDYNIVKNLNKYGQQIPPNYNISRISAPVVLIYGKNDPISTQQDSHVLKQRLTHVPVCEAVKYAKFTHIDFLWATHAKTMIHDRVMYLIETYRNYNCSNNNFVHASNFSE